MIKDWLIKYGSMAEDEQAAAVWRVYFGSVCVVIGMASLFWRSGANWWKPLVILFAIFIVIIDVPARLQSLLSAVAKRVAKKDSLDDYS